MAYKFQLGTARLSGSATYIGDIEAGSNIKGVDVSGSGLLKITGTAAAATVGDKLTFSDGTRVQIKHGNNPKLQLEVSGAGLASDWEYPRLNMFLSNSNSDKIISLENNTRQDEYNLQIYNNAGVTGWSFNDEATGNIGHISGSGNLQINGNVTIGGDVEVAGDLTVNGSTVALDTGVSLESGSIQVSASAADDAASQGAGYIFGQASSVNGGLIIYTSGSEEGKHIAIQTGAGAGAAFKAADLIGDGSNLTGITSTARYEVNEISASTATPPETLSASRTNIITNAPDTSGSHRVNLPQTSSLTIGQMIRVKLQATANEENYLKIGTSAAAGQNMPVIDGSLTFDVLSPSASVDIIYLGTNVTGYVGTGSFAIF